MRTDTRPSPLSRRPDRHLMPVMQPPADPCRLRRRDDRGDLPADDVGLRSIKPAGDAWCGWLMELDSISAELPAEPESAHTSSRKSARNPRIELITRGERRRRWTIEQKQTIAAQSLAPGASPTEVARQYGISSGQLYTWRHALLAAQPEAVMHTAGRFAAWKAGGGPHCRK